MPLTKIHIALLQRAAGDLVMIQRKGGQATASADLLKMGLVKMTERRMGNKSIRGFVITDGGREILQAALDGKILEERVPVIPMADTEGKGFVLFYNGQKHLLHEKQVLHDEQGPYIELISIKGANDATN